MPNWSGLKKSLPASARRRLLLIDSAQLSVKSGLLVPQALPLVRQAELLGLAHSSLYYQPTTNPLDKPHMDAIDAIYTDLPFYGSRRIRLELQDRYGIVIGRERVQHLMRKLGIEAIYPKPNTSKTSPLNEIYPYLLRGLAITYINQVWGSDITYIRTAQGFVYLVAFIDWFSRYVVGWQLSETMDTSFCSEALNSSLLVGIPDISNTDQGSQFTSLEFTEKLKAQDIRISMDGRGRCMDNIFTERLWRTVKYENVYLKSYQDFHEAQAGLTAYFTFYNERRRHQSLDNQTPASIYFG